MPPKPSAAVLVARPAPCPRCGGRGSLPAVSCNVCGFMERVTRTQEKPFIAAWYSPEKVEGLTHFPACGHVLSVFLGIEFLTAGEFVCPECGKEGCEDGQIQVWHTAAEWARQDAQEAKERKQGASEAARVLSEHGRLLSYSRVSIRRMLKLIAPTCEAHCRTTGRPCPKRVVLGQVRCRLHGGLSTGPKTAEGRTRIGASRRERAEKQRTKKATQEKANELCSPN